MINLGDWEVLMNGNMQLITYRIYYKLYRAQHPQQMEMLWFTVTHSVK